MIQSIPTILQTTDYTLAEISHNMFNLYVYLAQMQIMCSDPYVWNLKQFKEFALMRKKKLSCYEFTIKRGGALL